MVFRASLNIVLHKVSEKYFQFVRCYFLNRKGEGVLPYEFVYCCWQCSEIDPFGHRFLTHPRWGWGSREGEFGGAETSVSIDQPLQTRSTVSTMRNNHSGHRIMRVRLSELREEFEVTYLRNMNKILIKSEQSPVSIDCRCSDKAIDSCCCQSLFETN